MKIFAENRKARNSYDFTEYLEAGIVLTGSETKSIRNGGVSIVDAFAIIENEEAVIREMNIEQYKFSNELDYNSKACLLYTSPSPRDRTRSRMPSSA